jgi:hypothetical protein
MKGHKKKKWRRRRRMRLRISPFFFQIVINENLEGYIEI